MDASFLKAIPILHKLQGNGFEAYFVGGAVRDYLLKKQISDIDIATSALPKDVMKLFPKTIEVGIEHGTVVVVFQGEQYEITTFRSEGKYEDHRRPSEVTFVSSLKEDLQRRDFTINAMAMDDNGSVIDPYNGQEDLNKKIIRAVGNSNERFQEDALRMMRALRFMSQLDFAIAKETIEAMKANAELLSKIAIERIAIEFEKLLLGIGYDKSLEEFIKTGLIDYVPFLAEKHICDKNFSKVQSLAEKWALLLCHLEENEVEKCLRIWKRPNHFITEVKSIVKLYQTIIQTKRWTKELLYNFGWSTTASAARLYCSFSSEENGDTLLPHLLKTYESLPIHKREDLAYTGTELMQHFNQKPGPWIGELIEKIEKAVIRGEVQNDFEMIKEWLVKCHHP
ncbi:CCA tRNA nucleotidyltransferase [Lottiidibacillus patelloidae]|uniref:CCA-adding enzyme n=1 Tax=Lottiidibacillus patelloidae TaxID=2670334 RepID=A0A263BUC9_9BACI|nr:CCA tRNA nucleotidyltransferase [Lottiidibacillus patelloidae]OZM57295.1 CCA tRNA nucleotidyltransferase [Lottiidibacillus patelloidae]